MVLRSYRSVVSDTSTASKTSLGPGVNGPVGLWTAAEQRHVGFRLSSFTDADRALHSNSGRPGKPGDKELVKLINRLLV